MLAWLLAGTALAVVVVVQLPAFLCMGLDSDIIMYDVVARQVMRGSVHYRDLLETNFPGIVWLHLAFRSLFGWRSEPLRAVDLAIVGGVVWLLVRWLPGPGEGWRRVALALVLVAYYISTNEWCHCQRDTWMLLPAVVALNLRSCQAGRLSDPDAAPRTLLGWAFVEGMAWAVAFWIKPFVGVPGLACWLQSARLARGKAGLARRLLTDLAGFLGGGLLVGAAGIGWLVATGAWPAFTEVMFGWNREYFWHDVFAGRFWLNLLGFLERSSPWVLAHLAAVPLALVAVWWGKETRAARVPPLLGTFYLAWLLQAILLQHPFDYVYVPPTLLALAVLGIHGLGRLREDGSVAGVALLALFISWACPPLLVRRANVWADCVQSGSTPRVRDRVTLLGRVRWTDMEKVASFLREQGVHDGELTSFSLPTVLLYRDLDLEPSTRYLFLQDHLDIFASRRPVILEALRASRQRFVVCDLGRYGMTRMREILDRPGGPPDGYRWADRVVFRAGAYVVFRLDGREMPAWLEAHFGSGETPP